METYLYKAELSYLEYTRLVNVLDISKVVYGPGKLDEALGGKVIVYSNKPIVVKGY